MENQNEELKHLGFVKIAALNAVVCLSNLYAYVKENAGTMRSGFETVESQVTPVFRKFTGFSFDLLVFLDKKVDEAADKLDEWSPPLLKHLFFQTRCMVSETLELIQMVATDTRTGGLSAAVSHVASQYGPLVEEQVVKIWAALNQVPLFHMVAQMTVPTVAHWSVKYNKVVTGLGQKGYTVSHFLPLVPVHQEAPCKVTKSD